MKRILEIAKYIGAITVIGGIFGCSPKIAEPIYREGILISTEKVQLGNKSIAVHWRILTEKGDTIDRYLIRVDANTKEGSIVPYFDYK